MTKLRICAALAAGALAVAGCSKDRGEETTAQLRRAASVERAPEYLPRARWKVVRAVYGDREYASLWLDGDRLNGRGRDLVEALCRAAAHGLRPGQYDLPGLLKDLESLKDDGATAEELARLDLRLTSLFVDFGADLLAGQVDPRVVDSGWYIKERRAQVDSTLRVAARAEAFEAMLAPLLPGQPEYAQLVRGLASYRALAARGGWPAVPAGGALRPGATGPRVAALRARLAASGDLDATQSTGDAYDAALKAAVAHFQARHGLKADSVATPATLAAANVPVERRIQQLELNLERIRWLPKAFGDRHILVNIPDFALRAYDGGEEVLNMRVVVGKQYESATPIFADTMSYVVFRPYWNVPAGIVREEIVPKMRENTQWIAANNYELVDPKNDSLVIDPGTIDWEGVDTATFDYRVRQKPGPTNSLGKVKFMFPNQFDIYLHDTPSKSLFSRTERDFSHGCIRVEHPDRLARYVFSGAGGMSEAEIREAMSGEESRTVTVKNRLPVYIVYLTAFARGGALHFREDIYGADRRALARLRPTRRDAVASTCEAIRTLVGD